ncbi:hypothetical protein [Mesorhizobium sp. ES1-1]|uniref:hypothetical protein n=1 Tax=Mesorhizobium sp. ES1-1 TaxID=2876629 RepID=UPI001CC98EE5|nr:hypothetical protein [Mesorhizobium sp. ES1-1]MBZ9674405.1 hypothetical protein [Mesorhizobium sp. ES1-1]
MSALLGIFDHIVPGTALYLVFASALFYLPLMALAGRDNQRSWANWLSGSLLLFLLATPLVLISQGVIWKDVLFANLSLSAFASLVLARRNDDRRLFSLGLLALASIFAGLAASTRQNGLFVGLFAAISIAFAQSTNTSRGPRIAFALAWALLASGIFVAAKVSVEATAVRPIGSGISWGLTVLHRFDIVGMIVRGAPPFETTPSSSPESERIVASFRHDYDPSRIDTMGKNAEFEGYFRDSGSVTQRWWQMVRKNPLAWLEHRAAVFRWMVAPPDVRLCLPVWVGVDGPDTTLAELGIHRELRPQDAALYRYSTLWFDTPLFVNGAWALAALTLAGIILIRKRRAKTDIVVLAMLASGLTFAASFALIGIACDVRYLFLLPVVCCGALADLAYARPRHSSVEMSLSPPSASVGQ